MTIAEGARIAAPRPGGPERKVALVTGAAGGIGLSIAERLAHDGFAVAIIGRTPGSASAAAEAIVATGGVARGYDADVADREQVDAALAAVRDELGPLSVVVANAAIAPQQPFLEMTPEQWQEVIGINLTGTFHTVQAALPDLVEAGWGRVILISSSSAQRGAPRMAHYAASKGGQMAMTKALAVEFGKQGITVNTVAPSSVDTPSVLKKREAGTIPSADDMARFIPVGRVGVGQDIAAAVSYLASDEAGYVTGQTLSVNGGSFIG
jgi:2-hydroxycyclohexanecarboxyl-CoA dehydrogenase